jgi:hypothetical protein
MTTEHHSGNDAKTLASGIASGILEKVWDFSWCLKAIYVGLFADTALIFLTGQGLANSSFNSEAALANAGKILCTLLAFVSFVSLIIPVVIHILNVVAQRPSEYHQLPPDCVSPNDLKRLALEEKDDFLLKLYLQHNQDVKELQNKKFNARTLLVGLTGLVVTDHFVGCIYQTASIMTQLQSHLTWGVIVILLLALYYGITWTYEEDVKNRWIFYPPLATQQRNAEKEAEDRLQECRRRYEEQQRVIRQSDD